jgi:DNA ligase-1
MALITKPMLADPLEDMWDLKLPVLATPKLDGIRCLRLNGRTLSRKFLDIPNKHIQKVMSTLAVEELDGELVTLDEEGSIKSFNQIQGDVMREDGEPDFRYYVFDYVTTALDEPYFGRMIKLRDVELPSYCVKVLPAIISSTEQFGDFEEQCLAEGHEGIMVRSGTGPYKCGRSTVKQGYLLKVKRFKDSEAIVIGFEEQQSNQNEAEEDELGHTKRSKALAGMVNAGTLGKFLVQEAGDTPWQGEKFAIGTGENLTKELRQHIWDNRDKYIGKTVTYKYQPHGMLKLPRLPVWKGFRDVRDLS